MVTPDLLPIHRPKASLANVQALEDLSGKHVCYVRKIPTSLSRDLLCDGFVHVVQITSQWVLAISREPTRVLSFRNRRPAWADEYFQEVTPE